MVVMTDITPAAAAARENARHDSGRFGVQEHSTPELNLASADAVQWAPGSKGVLIASGTNPWLQVDGQPVDLMEIARADEYVEDCDGCRQDEFAGIALAMDTPDGIQRCDQCGTFDGDLEAAQAAADALTQRTGQQHTVWFTPEEAEPATAPFVFDKNYRNDEQVRPYMEEFLSAFDRLVRPGHDSVYNDRFKGQIPSLAGTDSDNEDTAIYLLQNLRRLDIEAATRAAFVEAGGRKVTADDIQPGQTLRGTVVHSGFYMGGTGWDVREDVRLRVRVHPNGNRSLEYVEKGKRNGSLISGGDVYFRED